MQAEPALAPVQTWVIARPRLPWALLRGKGSPLQPDGSIVVPHAAAERGQGFAWVSVSSQIASWFGMKLFPLVRGIAVD